MKISIITVVYNDVVNIQKTINSVLEQKGIELEYIVIDGGSTDGTVELIRKNEKKISYWESKKDNGIYDAMNKGIKHASGDIIAFINSGDWYEKDSLQKISLWFENNNADILICGVNMTRKGKFVTKRIPKLNEIKEKVVLGMPCCHQGIFAKKKWLEGKHSFNTKYKIAADYDWLLGCYYEGSRIECNDIVVASYDMDGVSARKRRKTIEELQSIAIERLKLSSVPKTRKISNSINKFYIERNEILAINECLKNDKFDWEPYSWIQNDTKYSIFGCGIIGEECCRLMERLGAQVVCIWDNDSAKWGRYFMGKEICSPQNILQDKSIIIIASTLYEEQIEQQLKEQFGKKREQYIIYRELRHEIGQKLIKELHLEETKGKC